MIQALGKITVPVPGTPVQAAAGLAAEERQLKCHAVLFQALPTNVGKVYIGLAGMNKSTLVGVYAVLAVPTANQLPTFSAALTWSANGLPLSSFYVDADDVDEGALCTILVA